MNQITTGFRATFLSCIALVFSGCGRWELSPLHMAVKRDDLSEAVRILEEKPHLVNDQGNEFSESPLSLAVESGSLKMVGVLIKHGADVNARLYANSSCLMAAAKSNHIDIAKALLDSGALINAPEAAFENPLIIASRCGNQEMVDLLSQRGADINFAKTAARGHSADIVAMFPLKAAAAGGHLLILESLIQRGAEVNLQFPNDDAAIHAAMNGHYQNDERIKAVELLLDQGADINALGYQGRTPLHLATEGMALYDPVQKLSFYRPNDPEFIQFLIDCGADPRIQDQTGKAPLDYAEELGHGEVGKVIRRSLSHEYQT